MFVFPGLALAPWNVLAAGRLRTDAEEEKRRQTGEKGRMTFQPNWERTEDEKKMSAALEKVAKEVGTEHITAVAIAYVMQKTPYVFPIIGGRKIEHLMANIEALKISLSDEQIKYLENVIPFDPGFPSTMIVSCRAITNLCMKTDEYPRVTAHRRTIFWHSLLSRTGSHSFKLFDQKPSRLLVVK